MNSELEQTISFKVYTDFDSLREFGREWDNFVKDVGGEIFLTYDWCRLWWKYYGRKRELAIFVAYIGQTLCAILPCFREKLRIGPVSIRAVKFVASDYMPVAYTVPIKSQYLDRITGPFLEALAVHWPGWHVLHATICGRFNSLEALTAVLKKPLRNRYRCELAQSDVQTYFSISKDWETQVASLASKQRTNVRRTYREASSKGIEISSRLASPQTLQVMFDNFVDIHQKHWRGIGRSGHFGAWPLSRQFHREMAEIELPLDRLRLIEISFNGSPVGYEYLYRFGETYYWFLNARTDFDNPRIDYKWIAFRSKIENALKDGVTTIDGMRGMYDYKVLMGGQVVPINDLFVYDRRFSVVFRVSLFRLVAKVVNICYYRVWRTRVAPRLGIKLGTFWDKWVRLSFLSAH